jgi:hypothetical protein
MSESANLDPNPLRTPHNGHDRLTTDLSCVGCGYTSARSPQRGRALNVGGRSKKRFVPACNTLRSGGRRRCGWDSA